MAARYDWFGEEGMKRDDEGFYVRHEDYARELADAQAEIARLRGALEENAQLHARVVELEALVGADITRAFNRGYARRDAEVMGALV